MLLGCSTQTLPWESPLKIDIRFRGSAKYFMTQGPLKIDIRFRGSARYVMTLLWNRGLNHR